MRSENRDAFRRIKAVANAIRRRMEGINIEEKADVTRSECAIMGFLADNTHRPIYQKDVEEEFCVRSSSATRALQSMERKGLISRVNEAHDGRLKRLVLTEHGIEISRHVDGMVAETEQRLLRGISPEELDIFLNICDRIYDNVEGEVKS